LKAEVLSGPPFDNIRQAEAALAKWRHVYNTERPHEALNMAVPISRYRPSPRSFCEDLETFDYASHDIVRRVQQKGSISFKGTHYRLPNAFQGKDIALRPTQIEGTYDIYYRHHFIKTLDTKHK
jgi:hypothetical protein